MNIIDFSTLTVSNTAVGFDSASPAMPTRAKGFLITVEDADVRWRADGSDPTSTEGHRIRDEGIFVADSTRRDWRQLMNAIKFIRTGSADASLKISWTD